MTILNRFYEEMFSCGHYITVNKIKFEIQKYLS